MIEPARRLPLDRRSPDEAEAAVADLAVERLYLYDRDDRQVAIFEGDEARVFYRLTDRERRRLREGKIVHNHPPNVELPQGNLLNELASFSIYDWRAASDLDVVTMVVVTPAWRFELTRPVLGWYARYRTDWEFEDMLTSLLYRVSEEDGEVVNLGLRTKEDAEATLAHRVSARFANEIKANYAWRRR